MNCQACKGASFSMEIERSASGWESYDLDDFIPRPGIVALLDDGPSERYWRTQSFLKCKGVSGEEIAAFCAAPIEARRALYVAWKRRELEAALNHDQRVCGRCRVIYTIYRNAWNRSGYCSRSCAAAASKSRSAAP